MEEKQWAAGQAVGGITSERADLSDEVLFGDVWEREGLSPARPRPGRRHRPDRALPLGFHLVLAPDTAPD
ncbi:hypothetical protein [Streptomyces californicus]|uniref:hypothetical protein n=1 Tax=Streptomyces californicus TaxID=67351 RepID=UPI0035D86D78